MLCNPRSMEFEAFFHLFATYHEYLMETGYDNEDDRLTAGAH